MSGGRQGQASPLASRAGQSAAGAVRVIYGVHALEAPVAGRTVADVRAALSQALNLSPEAMAVVDGMEAGEHHVLRAGEQLEFVRLAGEKGQVPVLRSRFPVRGDPRPWWASP
jgi:hypothetical protein